MHTRPVGFLLRFAAESMHAADPGATAMALPPCLTRLLFMAGSVVDIEAPAIERERGDRETERGNLKTQNRKVRDWDSTPRTYYCCRVNFRFFWCLCLAERSKWGMGAFFFSDHKVSVGTAKLFGFTPKMAMSTFNKWCRFIICNPFQTTSLLLSAKENSLTQSSQRYYPTQFKLIQFPRFS